MKKSYVFLTVLGIVFAFVIGCMVSVNAVLNNQVITCNNDKTKDNYRMCEVTYQNTKAYYATIDKQ